jgi:hypothetical protein
MSLHLNLAGSNLTDNLIEAAEKGYLDFIKEHIPGKILSSVVNTSNLLIQNTISSTSNPNFQSLSCASTGPFQVTLNFTSGGKIVPNFLILKGDNVDPPQNSISETNNSIGTTISVKSILPAIGEKLLYYAAKASQMEVFKYLWDLGYKFDFPGASLAMSLSKKPEMIDHLISLGYEISPYIIKNAIVNRNLSIIEHFLNLDGDSVSYLPYAVDYHFNYESRHDDIIKILVKRGHKINYQDLERFIARGYFEMMIYILEHGAVTDFDQNCSHIFGCSIGIFRPGCLQFVKYVVGKGYDLDIQNYKIRIEVTNYISRIQFLHLHDTGLLIYLMQIFPSKFFRSLNFGSTNTVLNNAQRKAFDKKIHTKNILLKVNLLKYVLKPMSMHMQLSSIE